MKLYIHIRNLKPPSHCEQDSCNCEQDNMTFRSVFLSTDKKKKKKNSHEFYFSAKGFFFFVRVDSLLNKVIEYQLCGLQTLLWPIKSHIPQVEWSGRHGLLTQISSFEHSLRLESLVTWISQVFRKECDAHC